jgi:hypothetical protein
MAGHRPVSSAASGPTDRASSPSRSAMVRVPSQRASRAAPSVSTPPTQWRPATRRSWPPASSQPPSPGAYCSSRRTSAASRKAVPSRASLPGWAARKSSASKRCSTSAPAGKVRLSGVSSVRNQAEVPDLRMVMSPLSMASTPSLS